MKKITRYVLIDWSGNTLGNAGDDANKAYQAAKAKSAELGGEPVTVWNTENNEATFCHIRG